MVMFFLQYIGKGGGGGGGAVIQGQRRITKFELSIYLRGVAKLGKPTSGEQKEALPMRVSTLYYPSLHQIVF